MYDVLRMQRISVHIPEETRKTISLAARTGNKTEAEIIRDALDKGLKTIQPKSNAQALLDLAEMAKKIPSRPDEPKDVSINHDYYAWGGEKRKK